MGDVLLRVVVSEMIYTVLSGTLNSSIPYHTTAVVTLPELRRCFELFFSPFLFIALIIAVDYLLLCIKHQQHWRTTLPILEFIVVFCAGSLYTHARALLSSLRVPYQNERLTFEGTAALMPKTTQFKARTLYTSYSNTTNEPPVMIIDFQRPALVGWQGSWSTWKSYKILTTTALRTYLHTCSPLAVFVLPVSCLSPSSTCVFFKNHIAVWYPSPTISSYYQDLPYRKNFLLVITKLLPNIVLHIPISFVSDFLLSL